MEKKKCSSKEDKDIDAICYCGECRIYMCNKCEKFHSKLFAFHQTFNIDKNIDYIFTGFCKEPNHPIKLQFFCKNHNILCCAACLCKIEKDGIGLHKDCNVCLIEDIKEEKKNNIKANIKYLEELSNTLQGSIDNLKKIFENIIKNKEELKLSIQKTFTKIRNELNNREDELLLEVDKQFNETYCDEVILKQCEKLPNKVKISLEKGKSIELNDDKLALFVNECINIEKNIRDINNINDNIKKIKNDVDVDIIFFSDEKLILENIKTFGKIVLNIIESEIIKGDKEKQEIIINWIKQKTNKKKIKFEKIFVMSVNGSSSQDFHKYCDNKGPTLTIIKTTKNRIFGGFTPLNWETGEDEEFNNI